MAMIPYATFVTTYKVEPNPALYAQLTPIAEARALVFPTEFRELAAQYYLGYILCMTAGDRTESEIKSFKVEPDGYSVSYADAKAGQKCANWLELLRQLAMAAKIDLGLDNSPAKPQYADRTENFNYSF